MRRPLSLRTLVPVVALAAAALAVPATASQAAPSAGVGAAVPVASGVRAPAPVVPLTVGDAPAVPTSVAEPAAKAVTARFVVTYHGFSAPARAAFQRAVDYWSTQVTSSVPITVDATYTALGPGILGSAGPSSVWRDFAGAPKAGTWYVDAVANRRHGSQLDPSPDVVARFSSSFGNWSFGTGSAPAGTYDFQSVVTHELGHGLGFLGAGIVSSGQSSVRLLGFPIAYDLATRKGTTKLLSLPDGSATLASALTSNAVTFDTTKVRGVNGGKPASLYAPSTWQQGSSYSHLDEATYRAGDRDSLMTPKLGSGETIRSAGPITKAVLKAVGW
ncbi:hypothetical protein [Lapillicoccus jejuensis]|uniref:Matrixin n=1 Tax=Lapillicoccus jejuensis TaxID=402171 RepID=A0A542E4V3_9MICO|nr:hypothetical protein [Lapillicoccus jejuensis]TQJ10306.1 hypothetical protein FB458_3426 [Lapillicoccus jejuensis]